jgi:glucan 1,3-beta-glucosidase
MIGGLPLVGLNSTWDDSAQANPNVPPLNQSWGSYGAKPIRGVNLGGWFSLEPFITPSIFEEGGTSPDEYNICLKLGDRAAEVLEKHYATFYTEDDFRQIAAAGLDHVRIPFSYWAVTTYPGDPYVKNISWRYLLRAIEWARKYGLRVKLDPHGMPGSQNGWNHSGRSGDPNWIIGPNGPENAQKSLDIHRQLSQFFAQPRYKNVIAFYGLVNEPHRLIPMEDLNSWTRQAYDIVRNNGVTATQIFSESMRGLSAWAGQLQGYGDTLALDVHQYTLFDNALIGLKHVDRISFACGSYKDEITHSMTGFGPTMAGEWSQADTDCTKWLNGVGMGARWEGKFDGADGSERHCPTLDQQCSCDVPNAAPSTWTPEYKLFLKTFAEAQMSAFESAWGWFYWTWKTESAAQWSYQAGVQGGYMPKVAYERAFSCGQPIPSFGALPEFY